MTGLSRTYLIIAVLCCFLMPSNQSLWMDEAATYRIASLPSLKGVFAELQQKKASESLMPIGMASAWLSARVLGVTEWEMRAGNILWAALAAAAFTVIGRKWRLPWAPLFLIVQPFLWFYSNEARPYVLQIACGAWLVAGLVVCIEEKRLRTPVFLILLLSSCVLVATTLFGVLTVGPVWIALVWLAWRERWALPPKWPVGVAIALVFCGGLGVYYMAALSRGAGGAKLWSVGLQNVAFSFYEFAGFSGLGPSRAEIREIARLDGGGAMLRTLGPSLISTLLLAGTYIVLGGWLVWRREKLERRATTWIIAAIIVASSTALLLLATIAHFPFWGRHLAPVFPFFCALLMLAIREIHEGIQPAWAKAVIIGLVSLLVLSSLQLRFLSRHAKDDYRSASTLALEAIGAGKVVWWSADSETGRYYHIAFQGNDDAPGGPIFVSGKSAETLADKPQPDVIIASKPDVWDVTGVLADYIQLHDYRVVERLSAFQIYAHSSSATR